MGKISHSIFENEDNKDVLSQSELNEVRADIFDEAKRSASLKDVVLEHAATYGVENIESLYPDAKLADDPSTINIDDEWVKVVLDGVRTMPFGKIKSVAFDITAAQARAKGYIKGNRKVQEVINALKRETLPQTVYKSQALDRDDIIDITDFDIVAYLKSELKIKTREEIARAILIGDGRLPDAEDKIKEDKIRPIASDDGVYSIKKVVTFPQDASDADKTNILIEAALRARKDYKGSGSPKMFASSDYLTTMLIAKDEIGRRLYANQTELASHLRVSDIVETPIMEGAKYTDPTTSKVYDILAVIVNLKDYTLGAHKRGEATLFEDFDIHFNKQEYLLETRASGALTKPYSAIVLVKEQANNAG